MKTKTINIAQFEYNIKSSAMLLNNFLTSTSYDKSNIKLKIICSLDN